MSLDKQSRVLYSLFLLYAKLRLNSAFTCNQDEIYTGMKKFLFTREFHPWMKRVEFHPGMKFRRCLHVKFHHGMKLVAG